MNDPIANLIISIKNASISGKKNLTLESSNKVEGIVKVLKQEGFVADYVVNSLTGNKKEMTITLKYDFRKLPVITDIKQVSKPGLRIYKESAEIPHIKNGLGIAIISTNKGIVSDKFARENNVGGEYILKI
jgi:small subunit ribosomal protein S8